MLLCSPNGGTPAARPGSDKTAYVRGFDKFQDEDSVCFCESFQQVYYSSKHMSAVVVIE